MNKRWKVLFGALTMSAMLAAGCGPNTPTDAKGPDDSTVAEAENTVEVARNSSDNSAIESSTVGNSTIENSTDSWVVSSGESLATSADALTDPSFVTKPADAKTLDALPDLLRNSGLPNWDYPKAVIAVEYYDPAISGDISIISYDDGEAEIYFNCDNNTMIMEFYKPSGTLFSFGIRGDTGSNSSAPVFSGRDIRLDGKDFAEFSKDLFNNAGYNLSNYYGEYSFTEDLEAYKQNLNIIFARFGILSHELLDELGLSWEDFGIHFGEEYKKYDANASLLGTYDRVPMLMEKQSFTKGINDSTGKTWVETVREGIMAQAIYHSYDGEEPVKWFAYNDFNSNNFVDASDYVQFETYRHEDGCRGAYHSTDILEDDFSSKDFTIDFEGNAGNDIWIGYSYQRDYRSTGTPGVVTSDTRMGFGLYCKPEEVKNVFASEDSLKAALKKNGYIYEESQYMTNDEMIADFMSKYKRYMGSIDDGIKTMGTCLADYGIEY